MTYNPIRPQPQPQPQPRQGNRQQARPMAMQPNPQGQRPMSQPHVGQNRQRMPQSTMMRRGPISGGFGAADGRSTSGTGGFLGGLLGGDTLGTIGKIVNIMKILG